MSRLDALEMGELASRIHKAEVTKELLDSFASEEDYNELSVFLGNELASWGVLAAGIIPPGGAWSRDEAILVGLLVRFNKLLSGILDQTCQRRREITFILGRLAFECLVNTRYLIEKGDEKLYQVFVLSSLRHEKRLIELVEANIGKRSGTVLPIEERMMRSIENAFKASGASREDVTKEATAIWSDSNLYRRADEIGWGEYYLGLFAGPSHSVHGNWHDLLEYHLDTTGDGFIPDFNWHHPRPHMLLVLGVFGAAVLGQYADHVAGEDASALIASLDDLGERFWSVNVAHEAFLSARQTGSAQG